MGVGEMNKDQFTHFLVDTLGLAAARCRGGAIAYVFMDWRHMGELLNAGEQVFSELKNLCVWNKTNGGMGSFYRSRPKSLPCRPVLGVERRSQTSGAFAVRAAGV